VQKTNEQELIQRAFDRASDLDFFVARDLILYRKLNGIDRNGLARLLGCTAEGLHKLGLCRRPDSTSPLFRTQVDVVARHAGVDAVRLASLLRETEVAKAMESLSGSQRSATASGSLMAARDRAQPRRTQKSRNSKHQKSNRKKK
jgi:hypothetical protein